VDLLVYPPLPPVRSLCLEHRGIPASPTYASMDNLPGHSLGDDPHPASDMARSYLSPENTAIHDELTLQDGKPV
jgi:hypothetical protein